MKETLTPKTTTLIAAPLQRKSELSISHINHFLESLSITSGDNYVGRGEYSLICMEKEQ